MMMLRNPDVQWFWRVSLVSALVFGLVVGVLWPKELPFYTAGVGLGGLYWASVARRTQWVMTVKHLSGRARALATGMGLLTVLGLSAGVGLLAVKHPIVFMGLFIYKLGIVACFVRAAMSPTSSR